MASKKFTGFLRTSLGSYASHDLWRFTHINTTGEVVAGSAEQFKVEPNGFYDIEIEYGNIVIESKNSLTRKWFVHGSTVINSDTVATTLPALLNATVPVSDPVLLQMQTLLADAQNSASQALESEQNAAASAASIDPEPLKIDAALQALVAISGGKWALVTDNFGNAQCMRRVPIHTFEDLNIPGCPFTGPLDCFIRQDGSYRPYVDVAVYQASSKGGKAVSQGDKDPWVSINADTARARCTELNASSMMISQEIWAMLCWNIISQGFQPRGNTEYGRSHSNKNEFGRRADGRVPDDRDGNGRTLTGSGPEAWRHDGTIFGVADIVGNIWEWVDGMKMVNGQFIVAEYTGQPETEWLATGVYISNTGQFTNIAPSTLNTGDYPWGNMPKASGYVGNERLQRLIIEPIACTSSLSGRFYWNLDGERFPIRGNRWTYASDAGPASMSCYDSRSVSISNLGFRPTIVS